MICDMCFAKQLYIYIYILKLDKLSRNDTLKLPLEVRVLPKSKTPHKTWSPEN